MKRVKIMLLSLTLLAIVGGALAFKAKFSDEFCTTSLTSYNGVTSTSCPILKENQRLTTSALASFYTTIDPEGDPLDCKLDNGAFVPCDASTTIIAD